MPGLDLPRTIPGLADENNPAVAYARGRQQDRLNKQTIYDQESEQRQQQNDAAGQNQRDKESAFKSEEARRQQELEQGRRRDLGQVMAGDITQSAADPAYAGKAYDQIDPETRQHYFDAYGPAAADAPAEWNRAQTAQNPSRGIPGLEAHSATVDDTGKTVRNFTQPPAAPVVPSDVRSELIRMGKWKEGMTSEEASNEREKFYTEKGIIPERDRPLAEKIASQLVRHPILAPFAKQKEAYDTMRSGFENPQSGGFGDMAMIEGFQRIVNPGAVVRQQTMNQMLAAAGLGQYGSWDFLRNKLAQGDKLSPESRTRLMNLAEQTFQHSKVTASRELAAKREYARMLGVANPEAFVNSVMTYIANAGEEPQPGATGAPAPAQAPSTGTPKPGEVRDGYRFKGGNPADQNSWEAMK